MNDFHLIIEPGTPFVIPPHAIHLDALLYYCIGARWDISDKDELDERMRKYLAFDEEYGVFKASAMTMLATPQVGITTGSIQRADDLRNKLTTELFETKKKTIVIAGGPTKKRLTVRSTYHAPYIHFSGVGDAESIKKLLMNHLPGFGQDSTTSSSGEIRSIKIMPGEFSYESDGLPVRNLPLKAGDDFGFVDPEPVTLNPPYYNKNEVTGFLPDRVMIKPFNLFRK